MIQSFDIIIIGGGAAGFFTALNIAEQNPKLTIAILERGKEVLTKVKISGGGRCNVTHACFIPNDLVKFYPRGEKELKGPFNQFCSGDTIAWFEKHKVNLKIEEDGRMFPESDSSQTIIDCFINLSKKYNIQIITSQTVQNVFQSEKGWKLDTQNQKYLAQKIVFTTGSNPKMWDLLQSFEHKIVPPVPSLFTFNIKNKKLTELMGIAHPATVSIKNTKLVASGPLLITHWGVSGPAILRLSAWGARDLAQLNYNFTLQLNWMQEYETNEIENELKECKTESAKQNIYKKNKFNFPTRLWHYFLNKAEIDADAKWADLSKKQMQALAQILTQDEYQVNGKSTFKDEFVTAGGVDLKEINFKTMQSKILPNVYFAGEVVNIDAITGGFNFQNAWTTSYLAATHIANN
ncbi:NAD(P)/FAD-dependent oxidoreductase [Flavobacterium agricola]|uniref:NAD(P)/FAD-dependent oxidoreductase n=1 Tax=Flavobacterium agricola TaxID=2870839 RepID=A0ABY6LYI9_9FLAO|nr:NAD(P)/FAD-dependent oxidoreductase [Flavobacterium agricola]UYW01304.1 NAD(P)/FAD-dependent oxidoreductase [Flavobacterium agricola]